MEIWDFNKKKLEKINDDRFGFLQLKILTYEFLLIVDKNTISDDDHPMREKVYDCDYS